MQKFALSIINPVSYLVCTGLKDVENRTWTTDYRGRIYVHSSGGYDYPCVGEEHIPKPIIDALTEYDSKYPERMTKDEVDAAIRRTSGTEKACLQYVRWFLKTQDILRSHYGIDIYNEDGAGVKDAMKRRGFYYQNFAIIGHVDLVDIIRDSDSQWAEKNCYHWMLENPVLYNKPIENVKGRLRLFDVSSIDLP